MKNTQQSSTLIESNAGLSGQYVQILRLGSISSILFFLADGESAGADERFLLEVIAV
jgi:hypothetical protein